MYKMKSRNILDGTSRELGQVTYRQGFAIGTSTLSANIHLYYLHLLLIVLYHFSEECFNYSPWNKKNRHRYQNGNGLFTLGFLC